MSELSSANVAYLTLEYRNRTIITTSVCFPLGLLAVVLRFVSRRISRAGIWYDDWLALFALTSVGVFIGLMIVDLPTDATIRGEPIPESTLLSNAKTVYIAELFYYIIQMSLKASILAFYWRLFESTSMRVPIYLVACFSACWFIASLLVTAFQCIPVASLWDPELQATARCVELGPFFFGTSIPNILADLFLLILPMPYVWQLKIRSTQKGFVIGFFLLGGFVLIASALRLRFLLLLDLRGFNANWAVENACFWSAVEGCMGVVCICLPSLRPILRLLPFSSRFLENSGTNDNKIVTIGRAGSEKYRQRLKRIGLSDDEMLVSTGTMARIELEKSVERSSV
ncbi:uncharacterized protein CTRU02_206360 [Colletotrichum truncatum]|uniref:Uncharacterized protein n=1 Tax=Colletotrichum truncatum TaxID=5467 RepID=A0ACC3Z6Y3_COLTU